MQIKRVLTRCVLEVRFEYYYYIIMTVWAQNIRENIILTVHNTTKYIRVNNIIYSGEVKSKKHTRTSGELRRIQYIHTIIYNVLTVRHWAESQRVSRT